MRRCLNCMNVYEKEYEVCPYCGHIYNAKPAMDKFLPPGTVLKDRYILGTVIGSGGFGITYVAWDDLLQTKIAIKEYFPNTIVGRTGRASSVTVFGDENTKQYRAGLKRFLDEARRIAKFNKDESIVHVYDFIEANNTAYIVMEFLEGRTLKAIIEEQNQFAIDEAVKIVTKLADILEKVHHEGIIHRDLSPDNIILQDNGVVKLLDFGAARLFTEKEKKQFSVILKPSYSPPEQYFSDNKQDKRTDVYALGAVLYHMLTGKKPQESVSRMYEDELLRPSEINKKVPVWLDSCVLRAMCLKVNDRFNDMAEFKDALKRGESVKAENIEIKKPEVPVTSKTTNQKDAKDESSFTRKVMVAAGVTIGVAMFLLIEIIVFANPTSVEGDYLYGEDFKLSRALPYSGFGYSNAFAYVNNNNMLVLKMNGVTTSKALEYINICKGKGFDEDVIQTKINDDPYTYYFEGHGLLYKIKLRYKEYEYGTYEYDANDGRLTITLTRIAGVQ